MAPRFRSLAAVLAVAAFVGACAPADLVDTERSDAFAPDDALGDPEPPGTDVETTLPPDDPTPDTEPDDPPTTDSPLDDPVVLDPTAIDFGDEKPPRSYDDFLLAVAADIETWLAEEYPVAFGDPWRPLEGGIWAGYPERTDPLPGCGERETSYEDLQLYVAFYCPPGNGGSSGDFIVYDDGDDPVFIPGLGEQPPILFTLAEQFGPATIGIVLAHEYGHAVQQRSGTLDRNLATVVTEQQADCIAGAWAGRAEAGLAQGVPFDDDDVRAGLIAMITVQDPVGIDPLSPGGHGSGFDRAGAFQVGFQQGLERCAELIDDPLPLVPLEFVDENDILNEGNADFGFGEGELFNFLPDDLNLLYDNDLDADFPAFEPLELVSVQSELEAVCDELVGRFDDGAALCPATATVYLNEPVARDLYDEFGDFAPGYLVGLAWAEAAQISNGSPLTGEARALRNDCLTGNWVQSVVPQTNDDGFVALPEPRDPDRTASVSPNDLTEAIQAAILIGDDTADTDVIGSAFEKIDAFRQGTLNGLDSC